MKINWKKLIAYLLELRMDRQSDFAKRFGVGQQSVSNWIKGIYQPSVDTQSEILEYCKSLGVETINYLENKAKHDKAQITLLFCILLVEGRD